MPDTEGLMNYNKKFLYYKTHKIHFYTQIFVILNIWTHESSKLILRHKFYKITLYKKIFDDQILWVTSPGDAQCMGIPTGHSPI